MNRFKIYKIIFTIPVLLSVLIFAVQTEKNDYFFDNHPELKPTESLKKNFAVGSDICKNKNFYAPFEVEYCTWEYVKRKSIDDYRILENIRNYCLNSTECEYDRRECIEGIIYY